MFKKKEISMGSLDESENESVVQSEEESQKS